MGINLTTKLSHVRAARWGLVLVAPAAVFLLANVLNEVGVGFLYDWIDPVIGSISAFNLVSPIVFLGGAGAALALNALAIASVELRWEQPRLVSTLTIEPRLPNVALLLAGGLLLATFVAYGFVENYRLVPTHGMTDGSSTNNQAVQRA